MAPSLGRQGAGKSVSVRTVEQRGLLPPHASSVDPPLPRGRGHLSALEQRTQQIHCSVGMRGLAAKFAIPTAAHGGFALHMDISALEQHTQQHHAAVATQAVSCKVRSPCQSARHGMAQACKEIIIAIEQRTQHYLGHLVKCESSKRVACAGSASTGNTRLASDQTCSSPFT